MTLRDLFNKIEMRFKTLVQEPNGLVVLYHNAPPIGPLGEAVNVDIDTIFHVVVETVMTGNRQISPGSPGHRLFRRTGVIHAKIRYPLLAGTLDPATIADQIEAAFLAVTVDGIVYGTPTTEDATRYARWWQMVVKCPFRVDTVA